MNKQTKRCHELMGEINRSQCFINHVEKIISWIVNKIGIFTINKTIKYTKKYKIF